MLERPEGSFLVLSLKTKNHLRELYQCTYTPTHTYLVHRLWFWQNPTPTSTEKMLSLWENLADRVYCITQVWWNGEKKVWELLINFHVMKIANQRVAITSPRSQIIYDISACRTWALVTLSAGPVFWLIAQNCMCGMSCVLLDGSRRIQSKKKGAINLSGIS